jgi:protein-S-isoprenylcysteine O-methyltransferase Ste14
LRTCYARAEGAAPPAGGGVGGATRVAEEAEEADLTREGPARYLAYAARVKKFLAVK